MSISIAFRRPCRKKYISGYIWHKLFIQTVKCSFFRQIIVYPSFFGAPLTFSYFLLQGKVLCLERVGKSLVRFASVYFQSVPKTLSKKIYLRLHLTQVVHSTVKCSFFKKITVYLSFYGRIFWSVLLQNSSQCVVSSSFTFQSELSRSAMKFRSNLLRLKKWVQTKFRLLSSNIIAGTAVGVGVRSFLFIFSCTEVWIS